MPGAIRATGIEEAWYELARVTSRVATYATEGRYYEAPLYPTKLYDVSPASIEEIPVEKPSPRMRFVSGVMGGDWDKRTRLVEDDVVYRAFEQRFEEGRAWENTDYHSFMLDRLDDHSSEWRQYETMDDVKRRYESLDRLYRTIDREGYVAQHELESDKKVEFPNANERMLRVPPEFREITVYVARDGEFMWAAGMHRLCIAQLTDVERVPVRIRIRHERWQDHRDAVYRGDAHPGTHPDTRELPEHGNR